MSRNQIGVVGYGNIGSKIVDLLLGENIQPVVLVRDADKAQALEDDYSPAQLGSDIRPIFTTDYALLAEVDSVIVTASVDSEVIAATKSRNSLIEYNTPVICDISLKLSESLAQDTLIITVTNPVEGMVYALKNAGNFNSQKVIGVGTAVEAARYEKLISTALGIAREQVVSTVIGGHNEEDSVFLPECTKIGQLPLLHFNLSESELLELEERARTLGMNIFQKSHRSASVTPAALAVNLAKAHLNIDAKSVVNCTIEVPLSFVNQMLGNEAIDSNEPTVTLGLLALLNSQGAEPQTIPISRIDTQILSKAVRNIIKQQEMVRAWGLKI
jgi:malate dehydrogenase